MVPYHAIPHPNKSGTWFARFFTGLGWQKVCNGAGLPIIYAPHAAALAQAREAYHGAQLELAL